VDLSLAGSASGTAPTAQTRSSTFRRPFVAALSIVLVANVVGLVTALVQNVPGPPDGELARNTWIWVGTAYSTPFFLVVLAAVALLLSGQRGPLGVIATLVPMVVGTLADLSLTTDWPGFQSAITHHFNLLGFVAAWTLILVYPVVVLTGALDLRQRWSARRSA
jgi:hypothetical protein